MGVECFTSRILLAACGGVRRILVRSLLCLLLPIAPLGCGQKSAPSPSAVVGTPLVRVRVVDGARQVKLTIDAPPLVRTGNEAPQPLNLPPGEAAPVTLTPRGWKIGSISLGGGELRIDPKPEGSVQIEGTAYRGHYRFVPVSNDTFDVVNHVDVDGYLKGVLARELYADFAPEAFAAQAIAARTYALWEVRTRSPGKSWDLHADTRSQVYGGIKGETPRSVAAVDATAGVVLGYGEPGQEKIFKSYFSACCGGATQTAAEAFDEAPLEPYTDHRVDRRCDISVGKFHSRFDWGPIEISKSELTRRFRAFGRNRRRAEKDMGEIRRIDVFRANASGRPTRFAVIDARNQQYLLSGEDLRLAVNTSAASGSTLYSSFVTPVTLANSIRFQNGHGHGHGVGLCQWCAQAQAAAGVPHEAILRDAYKGAKLIRAY